MGNVEGGEWKEPTAVQMQSIPILAQGRDLLAASHTGSGKTGAFLVPSLALLSKKKKKKKKRRRVRVLILSPTRELCQQTFQETQRLAQGSGLKAGLLLSHVNEEDQDLAFDIVVSTPLALSSLPPTSSFLSKYLSFLYLLF